MKIFFNVHKNRHLGNFDLLRYTSTKFSVKLFLFKSSIFFKSIAKFYRWFWQMFFFLLEWYRRLKIKVKTNYRFVSFWDYVEFYSWEHVSCRELMCDCFFRRKAMLCSCKRAPLAFVPSTADKTLISVFRFTK